MGEEEREGEGGGERGLGRRRESVREEEREGEGGGERG